MVPSSEPLHLKMILRCRALPSMQSSGSFLLFSWLVHFARHLKKIGWILRRTAEICICYGVGSFVSDDHDINFAFNYSSSGEYFLDTSAFRKFCGMYSASKCTGILLEFHLGGRALHIT